MITGYCSGLLQGDVSRLHGDISNITGIIGDDVYGDATNVNDDISEYIGNLVNFKKKHLQQLYKSNKNEGFVISFFMDFFKDIGNNFEHSFHDAKGNNIYGLFISLIGFLLRCVRTILFHIFILLPGAIIAAPFIIGIKIFKMILVKYKKRKDTL